MKLGRISSLLFLLCLALAAGCASHRPSIKATPPVPPGSPGAVKYEKSLAYLLVEQTPDPEANSRARMESQFNLGYFGWAAYRLEGEEVKASALFTTRKSQVVSEERIEGAGWTAVLQKLEMEVSEVSGVPGAPGLRHQEIPLEQIKSPGSFLPAAQMDLLRELGKPEGWVRLVEISLRGDRLVLTWDVRF